MTEEEWARPTLDACAQMLRHVSPSDRYTRVRLGEALKDEFGDAAFDVFDAWYSEHQRYTAAEAKQAWRSFGKGGGQPCTIATLIYEAQRGGFKFNKTHQVKRTPEERARAEAEKEARRRQLEAEAAAEAAAAAARAELIWAAADLDPTGHAYLERKGIQPHGVRRAAEWVKEWTDLETGEVRTRAYQDALLVPIWAAPRKLASLQAIFPSKVIGRKPINGDKDERRDKDYLSGGAKRGCYFPIGAIKPDTSVVLVCEGFATGASLHEATGMPVMVAFDASNLAPVATMVRGKLPSAKLVICADNDRFTTRPDGTKCNTGFRAAYAAAAAVGGVLAVPNFDTDEGKPSDFNDLCAHKGLDAVRQVIEEAMEREVTVVLAPDRESAFSACCALRALQPGDELPAGDNLVFVLRGRGPSDLVVQVYGDDLAERTAAVCANYSSAHAFILARPGEEQAALEVAQAYGVRAEILVDFGASRSETWFDALMAVVDAKADADPVARELAGQALQRAAVLDVHDLARVNEMNWPHLDLKRMKPQNTIPNLRHLLRNYCFTVRYDVIRKEMQVTHPGQRGTMDNAKSKAIDTVVSLCALNQLPKTETPSFLLSIADESPHNPVMDYITSKEWDGVSRFSDLLATVQTKQAFDRDLLALLMRRWLVSAVAAAAKRTGFWSKGVLVFQGSQSLGKTAWFRALLPPEMRDLVKVGALIDPKEKDTIISAVSHWLVELGELDGTLGKTDTARLKGFISQDVDQFRRPYARAEEKFVRRTVFFASVNPETFLVDDTGNVRWWTIPVVAIDHAHGIDMQQVWAEVYTWYEAGEPWWLVRDEEAKLESSNASHEQADPIDELIASKYDFAAPTRRPLTATQVLQELEYTNPSKKLLNDSGKAMRKHFGEPSRYNGSKVYRVPNLFMRH